jgi:spermidine synthase
MRDADDDRPVVLERRQTPRGELVLRRAGAHFEVIANGVFLMDTRDGRSERALVRAAVAGRAGAHVLLGGLGVGFSLDEALAAPEVAHVTVVEVEPDVIRWHRTHLRGVARGRLDDPRASVVCTDLAGFLRAAEERFDAICLDVDNGPAWTVRPQNAWLYGEEGLAVAAALLPPGGRLAIWSAAADPGVHARLRGRFRDVRVVAVPVARGPDDVVYVASDPSTPARAQVPAPPRASARNRRPARGTPPARLPRAGPPGG